MPWFAFKLISLYGIRLVAAALVAQSIGAKQLPPSVAPAVLAVIPTLVAGKFTADGVKSEGLL